MNEHKDEILLPVLDSDATAVPRYNIVGPDGNVLYKNVSLKLMNGIAQEGTPINKPLLDEFLAASGVTAGSATAYTLAQEGYSLFDGAPVRFRLHTASGGGATLNINGTGAKPLRDVLGKAMPNGIPAGTWLTATYSSPAGAYVIDGGGGIGSNENLIDNWYFADPINQRGLTEYTKSGYTIDRWKLSYWNATNPKAVVSSDGITISTENENRVSNAIRHYQPIEKPERFAGKEVTLSVLLGNATVNSQGVMLRYYVNDTAFAGVRITSNSANSVVHKTATLPDEISSMFVCVEQDANNAGIGSVNLTLIAMKLELGPTPTIAHKDADGNWVLNDPPPDKGMELLKCIQSTADPGDTYANKVIIHTGNKNLIAPADIGAVNKAGDTMKGVLALVAGSTIGGNAIIHTGNIGNYLPADTGSAKVLTDVRLTSNTASVSITLPTDYNYFRIVISDITATTSATVKVDCDAATRRHEGIWLFDIMENNEPGITGIATNRYNRLIDVAVPDAESMASITMDAHRTPSGMQGQAIAVASDGDDAGTGEINIGTWYADQNNLTEITVSISSGYMRAGTGIMVVGVK